MFVVQLAELNICIDNKYPYIEDMCRDYKSNLPADFTVSVTDEEIMAEDVQGGFSPGYLESLAIYRKIANKIIEYDGFLMHGVVMSVYDVGVALCALSGTGKTTHSSLWQQMLGERCVIINGDKPLVRIKDNKAYAYGTPWAGKEGINTNARIELKKIGFIERALENKVEGCPAEDCLKRLMAQIYLPSDTELVLKTLDLIDKLMRSTDLYIIKCNKDISAAETAYEGMGIKQCK